MVFGGLQKNSFIDYPGKLSCVLFVSGCNFRCPYCHNPELVTGRPCSHAVSEASAWRFLDDRRDLLDGVVVSGGEPTIHRDLPALCERIKAMGYPVKLDTNGSRPECLEALLGDGLVDYVAMDVKTDPCLYPRYIAEDSDPAAVVRSIRVIMESGVPHEFRTTCVKPIVDDRVIERIVRIIAGARLYALQGFHDGAVLCPDFFSDRASACGPDELERFRAVAEPWVERCVVR